MMSHWVRGVLCVVCVLGAACGEEEPPIPTAPIYLESPEARPSFHPEDDLYDAEGNLRPSDDVVAGLILPRGLELDREEQRRHIYRSRIPIGKIVSYFGPKLFTGNVTRIGDGAVYRGATVVGVENAPRMTVSILTVGTQVRVEIHELPPPPVNPPSPAELERQWQEMQQRAE